MVAQSLLRTSAILKKGALPPLHVSRACGGDGDVPVRGYSMVSLMGLRGALNCSMSKSFVLRNFLIFAPP
jgi:hypothetical protein